METIGIEKGEQKQDHVDNDKEDKEIFKKYIIDVLKLVISCQLLSVEVMIQ